MPISRLASHVTLSLLLTMFGRVVAAEDPVPLLQTQKPPAPNMPRKLALLIGVGKYYQLKPGPGQKPWPELHVAQELATYRRVLIQDYGFADTDVVVLSDEQATRSSIERAFSEHLIRQAKPGDIVLFHFSGHGQHLPDLPPRQDEPDGLDESLVTYDALDQSVKEGSTKNIRDDDLGDWLEDLASRMRPSPGVPVKGNITVTLDACFSGSATRGVLIPRGRSWDAVTNGAVQIPQSTYSSERGAGILASAAGIQRDVSVVAAARADQTAWERDGQGVFTKHWVRLLSRLDKSQLPTYHSAIQSLALDVRADGLEQEPQAEGDISKQIFSGLVVPEKRSLRAVRGRDGSLWLQSGEIQGVTRDSLFELYSIGASASQPRALLGEAKVVEVFQFEARLLPLFGNLPASLPGVAAIEKQHAYGMDPLRIVLGGVSAGSPVRHALQSDSVVRIIGEQTDCSPPKLDHDLMLCPDPNNTAQPLQIWLPTGTKLQSIPMDPASLHEQLAAQWRRHHFISLKNTNSEARVVLELVPLRASRTAAGNLAGVPTLLSHPSPASHVALRRDDAFGLRFRNHSSRDLYLSVIAISPDGDIDVLFPRTAPGKNKIPAGADLALPINHDLFWVVGAPRDRIVIKVIATEAFVDLSPLQTSTQQTRTASPANVSYSTYSPLTQLLGSLGQGVRGAASLPTSMLWGTTDSSVTIE
jgi:hypothetical protein